LKFVSSAIIAAVLVYSVANAPARTLDYFYSDEFETNQVNGDSYWHSPIVHEFPDTFLYGILIFEEYGVRKLPKTRTREKWSFLV